MRTKSVLSTGVLVIVASVVGGLGGAVTATHSSTPDMNLYFHRSSPTGVQPIDFLVAFATPVADELLGPMDTTAPTSSTPALAHATPLLLSSAESSPFDAAWRSSATHAVVEHDIRFVWWVASANQGLFESVWRLAIWEQVGSDAPVRIAYEPQARFATTLGQIPAEFSYTFSSVSTSGAATLYAMIDAAPSSPTTPSELAHLILFDSVGQPSRIEFYPPNAAPTASIAAASSAVRTESVSFDGSASADGDGLILSHEWDFGDGTTGTGATASHEYGAMGTFLVTLTVTDDDGATASATHEILVGNAGPAAAISGPATAKKNKDVTFSGAASSDPDGTIASWSWDFGDGTTGTGSSVVHRFFPAGAYTVTLTVHDNDGASATSSHSILVT